MIDSCADKITVKDMETNKVYVVKEKKWCLDVLQQY
jgi:hypothetical protein